MNRGTRRGMADSKGCRRSGRRSCLRPRFHRRTRLLHPERDVVLGRRLRRLSSDRLAGVPRVRGLRLPEDVSGRVRLVVAGSRRGHSPIQSVIFHPSHAPTMPPTKPQMRLSKEKPLTPNSTTATAEDAADRQADVNRQLLHGRPSAGPVCPLVTVLRVRHEGVSARRGQARRGAAWVRCASALGGQRVCDRPSRVIKHYCSRRMSPGGSGASASSERPS